MRRRRHKRLLSALAGAVGGVAASFAMGLLHAQAPPAEQAGADATVKAANSISRAILRRSLTRDEKKWAGQAVHYAFGGLAGAFYGGLANPKPKFSLTRGIAYGSALCLLAHEIAVPAMGLSRAPIRVPLKNHAQEWGAHIVYGIVTDLTRAAVLKAA